MDNRFFVDGKHLSKLALEKKHRLETDPSSRTDHMEYLNGMEKIDSDIRFSVNFLYPYICCEVWLPHAAHSLPRNHAISWLPSVCATALPMPKFTPKSWAATTVPLSLRLIYNATNIGNKFLQVSLSELRIFG